MCYVNLHTYLLPYRYINYFVTFCDIARYRSKVAIFYVLKVHLVPPFGAILLKFSLKRRCIQLESVGYQDRRTKVKIKQEHKKRLLMRYLDVTLLDRRGVSVARPPTRPPAVLQTTTNDDDRLHRAKQY